MNEIQNINRVLAASSLGFLSLISGCSQTPSAPVKVTPIVDKLDETFSLSAPAVRVMQGKSEAISVGIKRGKDFGQDVALKFDGLPSGISLEPNAPVLMNGREEIKISVKATESALPGEYTVHITGHPGKGADTTSDLKFSVVKMDEESMAEVAKAKWEKYTLDMQKEWDAFSVKLNELSDRAAKAEGQAKVELDAKLAAAKVKMDEAGAKIEEMKSASADRWEKIKDASANAFDELKKAFD